MYDASSNLLLVSKENPAVPAYSRILLKLSGEAFAGGGNAVHSATTAAIAKQIESVVSRKLEKRGLLK